MPTKGFAALLQKAIDVAENNGRRLDEMNGNAEKVDKRLDKIEWAHREEQVRQEEREKYQQREAEKMEKRIEAGRWQITTGFLAAGTGAAIVSAAAVMLL